MKAVLLELSKKVSIYGLGTSFNSAASLLLVPYFVHSLLPVEYGRYALAEMAAGLLLVAIGLGMNVAIVAQLPRMMEEERRLYIGTVLGFSLGSASLVLASLLAGVAAFGPALDPYLPVKLVSLIPFVVVLEYLLLQFQSIYRALGGAWRFVSMSITQSIFSLALTIALISFFGFREEGIMLGRIAGAFMALIPGMAVIAKIRPRFNGLQVRAMLQVGLPLVPAAFCSLLVSMSPRYFLELFGTTEQVGVFAIASKVAGVMAILFVQPFSLAWMAAIPKVSGHEDAPLIYARVLTYFTFVGVNLATLLGLLSPLILQFFSHAQYAISPDLILVLCYANVASGLMYAVNLAPYVTGRTIQVLPAYLVSGLVSIVLCGTFTALWGLNGAAVALLCSLLFQSVLLGIFSQELLPVPVEWIRIGKCLVASAAALTVAGLLDVPVVQAAAFVAALALALAMLRFFEPSEYHAIRRILMPSR